MEDREWKKAIIHPQFSILDWCLLTSRAVPVQLAAT